MSSKAPIKTVDRRTMGGLTAWGSLEPPTPRHLTQRRPLPMKPSVSWWEVWWAMRLRAKFWPPSVYAMFMMWRNGVRFEREQRN